MNKKQTFHLIDLNEIINTPNFKRLDSKIKISLYKWSNTRGHTVIFRQQDDPEVLDFVQADFQIIFDQITPTEIFASNDIVFINFEELNSRRLYNLLDKEILATNLQSIDEGVNLTFKRISNTTITIKVNQDMEVPT